VRQLFSAILLFCLLFCSCKQKQKPIIRATPEFTKAILASERMFDDGHKDEALAHLRHTHAALNGLNIQDEMNFYSYCCNVTLVHYRNYQSALDILDTAEAILDASSDFREKQQRHIEILNSKADIYSTIGQQTIAYHYYYRCKKLASQTSDSCALSRYSYSLAMLLYQQKDYKEAAQLFKQSIIESRLCSDEFAFFYRRQEVLDNIGLCYSKIKMYDSALHYYRTSVKYVDERRGKYPTKKSNICDAAQAVAWGNMADIYIAKGIYDTAEQLLLKSIAINLQPDNTFGDAQLCQLKLGNMYYATKQLSKLLALLNTIEGGLLQFPNDLVEQDYFRLAWLYHEAVGDKAKGYSYLKSYTSKRDTLQHQAQDKLPADVMGKIKAVEEEQESRSRIEALTRQKRQNNVFLLAALIIIGLGIVIVTQERKSSLKAKKNVDTLQQLNAQINDQKQQLEYALSAVEARDKDKSRILRSVAHDVMSPIAAIAGLTDILITEGDSYSTEHQEILQMIKDACSNSLNLSRDILDAAVAIAPDALVMEPIKMGQLVHYAVDLLNVRAAAKKQTLKVQVLAPDATVKANKEKVWRVLNNLIGNAIKFSYEQSEILVKVYTERNKVIVSVTDQGIGIPEKNKEKIFDMFTESRNYGTAGEKPHGLGLSTSLQIAKAHNGDLYFESTERVGTTFYFALPIAGD
jgi:signal transduction histidine kinase